MIPYSLKPDEDKRFYLVVTRNGKPVSSFRANGAGYNCWNAKTISYYNRKGARYFKRRYPELTIKEIQS